MPPWGLAVAAMLSVQLGSALSVPLISTVGPAGTAWLRLTMGALIFIVLARPPLRLVRRRDLPALLGLGVTTGLVTTAFLAAIARIPLGTAVAVEFLGALTVAAVRSHSRRALASPALALVGVVLLTRPWRGDVNLAGLAFAALAAVGWATYILLTHRVGDRFSGIAGLSLTVPVAAVTAAAVGVPQALGHLTLGAVAAAVGLAVLLPVLPYAFEMLAFAADDPHRVRHADGSRARLRGAARAARAAPAARGLPGRRRAARGGRRCGRAAQRPAPRPDRRPRPHRHGME